MSIMIRAFYEIHKKINIHEIMIVSCAYGREWINILNGATICKLCIISRLYMRRI